MAAKSKGRSTPPLPADEVERRRVLSDLDLPAARSWGLLGDDATALRSMHEARIIDPASTPKMRRESRAWLVERHPDSAALL